MKNYFLGFVCFSLMVSLCFLPSDLLAQATSFDALFKQAVAEEGFSGVVLVADQGEIIYQEAASAPEVADQSPPLTAETPIRIASITKAFTAILVMQLVEAGQLSLDTHVAELLPDLGIKRAKKITVRDLLRHSSGLPNEVEALFLLPKTPQEMILETVATQDYYRYGRFNYSNLDYLILGLMIEKITEKGWEEVLKERILEPVGMTHTGVAHRGQADLAQGYLSVDQGDALSLVPEPSYYIENFHAAASMYSTAGDLLKFDQALYSDLLLKPASIELMYTSHPELGYVALGSWVYDYYFLPSAPRMIERRGSILGHNHTFIRLPEVNQTLIILSNNDRFDPDTFGQTGSFKNRLIAALVGEEPSPR
ncbi:MAG: serine hydrolase domain-containing protein [Bacteroidota bacterium]